MRTFVKRRPGAPAGFFDAEARGLRWLAEAGAPVPDAEVVVTPRIGITRAADWPRWMPSSPTTVATALPSSGTR